MEEYLRKRQKLIIEDRAQRVDQNTTYKLSSEEHRADEILRRIRKEEGESIWGKEQLHASEQPFPGMEFLTGEYCPTPLLLVRVRNLITPLNSSRYYTFHEGLRYAEPRLS